jgi:hypothetical protein
MMDRGERARRVGLWLAGLGALSAWFAMRWVMFGDVL